MPGSVHDTRVFNEALQKYANKFPFPPEGTYMRTAFYKLFVFFIIADMHVVRRKVLPC